MGGREQVGTVGWPLLSHPSWWHGQVGADRWQVPDQSHRLHEEQVTQPTRCRDNVLLWDNSRTKQEGEEEFPPPTQKKHQPRPMGGRDGNNFQGGELHSGTIWTKRGGKEA